MFTYRPSRRAQKRERAAHHDSRRYLRRKPPKRSDPLIGLQAEELWIKQVRWVVQSYRTWSLREKAEMAAGGLRSGHRGPSAEKVFLRHSSGAVAAVDKALSRFRGGERKRLRGVLWGGQERKKEDRQLLGQFYRLVAVYLGWGDPYWSVMGGRPLKRRGSHDRKSDEES